MYACTYDNVDLLRLMKGSAMTVENRPIIKLQLYMQFLRIVNSRFWDDT